MPPRITNRYSLPQPVVNAVSEWREWKYGEISITQLLVAPQRAFIERMHWDDIEVDASDRLFILDGLADHYVLQQNADANAFAEERLYVGLDGWTITGQADYVEGSIATVDEHKLTDYKRTSVWAALSDKPDWHGQVNGYGYLWELNGFPVREAEIFARLRDWTSARAMNGGDYPPIAAMTIPVALWGREVQEDFLRARLRLHQVTWEPDYEPPPCTPEERWRRPTTYALVRGANTRASKVCDTLEEADGWRAQQTNKDEYRIEQRLGASVRCEGYCISAPWCPQYQVMKQERDDADQGTY